MNNFLFLKNVGVIEEKTCIQRTFFPLSNDDNDLEDGEIPSDEDDEPVKVVEPPKPAPEPPKPPPVVKTELPKNKNFDNKFGKNKKPGSLDRPNRQKASDDWAGDVEKAIKAHLEAEDNKRNHENKTRGKNKNKNRKRNRDEKEDELPKDQKVNIQMI